MAQNPFLVGPLPLTDSVGSIVDVDAVNRVLKYNDIPYGKIETIAQSTPDGGNNGFKLPDTFRLYVLSETLDDSTYLMSLCGQLFPHSVIVESAGPVQTATDGNHGFEVGIVNCLYRVTYEMKLVDGKLVTASETRKLSPLYLPPGQSLLLQNLEKWEDTKEGLAQLLGFTMIDGSPEATFVICYEPSDSLKTPVNIQYRQDGYQPRTG